MVRDFRFGIGLRSIGSADRLREKVRRFADMGYDVVHFPDHLGAPAPFPAMVAAADAAPGIRVGSYVLNAAFYRPALLSRDVIDVDLRATADWNWVLVPVTSARSSRPRRSPNPARANASTT